MSIFEWPFYTSFTVCLSALSGHKIRVTENYFSYFSTKTYFVDTQIITISRKLFLLNWPYDSSTLLSIPVVSMLLLFFQSEWLTEWILIRWLHQKPAILDLQCFQKRINPVSAGQVLIHLTNSHQIF